MDLSLSVWSRCKQDLLFPARKWQQEGRWIASSCDLYSNVSESIFRALKGYLPSEQLATRVSGCSIGGVGRQVAVHLQAC